MDEQGRTWLVSLRQGAYADFEAGGTVYPVEQENRAGSVFRIGRWRYDGWGNPLNRDAPAIRVVCDFRATPKHGNKAIMRDFEKRMGDQLLKARMAVEASRPENRQLQTLDRALFIRLTCQCGRTRLDQVGFLTGEARLGERTLKEYAGAARCGRWNCNGTQTASIEP